MKNTTISLNVHYRPQLLVGLGLGFWLYLFLALVGPFDAAELSLNIRIILMLGYGVLFFLCYALLIPVQNKFYRYLGKWKLGHEVAMVILFCLVCLPVSFGYYKTELVNGDYGFWHFTSTVYLPIIAILLPAVFLGRYLISRNVNDLVEDKVQDETVILLGENKLDILKVPYSDLVALEAANNYVTVHYILNGQLQKKLLRSSLSKLHKTVPEMIQVHRSYVINEQHFVEWKDGLTIGLTQFTVPVSQKYKASLLTLFAFTPK